MFYQISFVTLTDQFNIWHIGNLSSSLSLSPRLLVMDFFLLLDSWIRSIYPLPHFSLHDSTPIHILVFSFFSCALDASPQTLSFHSPVVVIHTLTFNSPGPLHVYGAGCHPMSHCLGYSPSASSSSTAPASSPFFLSSVVLDQQFLFSISFSAPLHLPAHSRSPSRTTPVLTLGDHILVLGYRRLQINPWCCW